jgi:parvulin-like peptidyl-prolyl isomerase
MNRVFEFFLSLRAKGRLKNYSSVFPLMEDETCCLAFCLRNVRSLRDFCVQIMPSYFFTIPKRGNLSVTAGRNTSRNLGVLRKETLVFLGLCSLLLFLHSCDQNNRNQTAFIPAEETIAFVNNKKITLATYNSRLHTFLEKYRKFIISDDKRLTEIKEIVINILIDEELIIQEAARKGIQVPEKEILAILNGAMEPNEGVNLNELVKNYKLDDKEWKNQIRLFLLKRKLIEKEVLEKTPVTKREIESYYQRHRADLTVPQGYQVRNITLATEEEANAILSQIKRGRSFRRLVRQHSISPDKNADGDLGFVEKGTLPLEMESAIFKLGFRNNKTRVSEVIRSQDGFHIFQLMKYRRRKRLNLNQARPEIKRILVEQKIHASYQSWLNRLKETATISIDRTMLAREEGF